ncbi:MAG: lysozyme inhibitor LprI family protein [Pseudomonadota bacterium]
MTVRSSIRALGVLAVLAPAAVAADPAMECGVEATSQVEIAACVRAEVVVVDQALEQALGFARDAAAEVDTATGRTVAVPALEAAQAAWAAYRDAECGYVAALSGGGSGSGIAETSCRIETGRARTAALMGSL